MEQVKNEILTDLGILMVTIMFTLIALVFNIWWHNGNAHIVIILVSISIVLTFLFSVLDNTEF